MSVVGFDMNRITVALHLSIVVAISAVTPQHLWHTMAWHCVYLGNGHKKWTRIKELIVVTITNISETRTDSSSGNHQSLFTLSQTRTCHNFGTWTFFKKWIYSLTNDFTTHNGNFEFNMQRVKKLRDRRTFVLAACLLLCCDPIHAIGP